MAVTVRMEVSHLSSTPIGMTLTIRVEIIRVDGRSVFFKVEAFDEVEKTSEGFNDMFIIDQDRFNRGIDRKNAKLKTLRSKG